MKKIKYFLFYLKFAKWKKLSIDLKIASDQSKKSRKWIIIDMIKSAYIFGTAFNEYFYFRFFEKTDEEKNRYAGSELMYEFQLMMNPKKDRYLVSDKSVFLKEYEPFVKRQWVSIGKDTNEPDLQKLIICSPKHKIVLKNARGMAGGQIKVLTYSKDFQILKYAISHKLDLAEEFVVQHSELSRLAPSSLNTIRIISWLLKSGEVKILGACLRASIDAEIDNMSVGGFAAPVDVTTGIVVGPGVFLTLARPELYAHPITKVELIGFQIPFWNNVINFVIEAAKHRPVLRSVGWDVGISTDGPVLIEGNHNWGKILWQLPYNKGMKFKIQNYQNL